MFGKKRKIQKKTYDPAKQQPILKCSICNGERVAGFKDLETGKFEEVMYIKNDADLRTFQEMYSVSKLTKEY